MFEGLSHDCEPVSPPCLSVRFVNQRFEHENDLKNIPASQSVSQPVSQSVGQSISRSASQSVNQSDSQSVGQSVSQSEDG